MLAWLLFCICIVSFFVIYNTGNNKRTTHFTTKFTQKSNCKYPTLSPPKKSRAIINYVSWYDRFVIFQNGIEIWEVVHLYAFYKQNDKILTLNQIYYHQTEYQALHNYFLYMAARNYTFRHRFILWNTDRFWLNFSIIIHFVDVPRMKQNFPFVALYQDNNTVWINLALYILQLWTLLILCCPI